MSEHRVKVENGKYEIVIRNGFQLDILRHGEPWVQDIAASKCLHDMMCELDAARVVLAATVSLSRDEATLAHVGLGFWSADYNEAPHGDIGDLRRKLEDFIAKVRP